MRLINHIVNLLFIENEIEMWFSARVFRHRAASRRRSRMIAALDSHRNRDAYAGPRARISRRNPSSVSARMIASRSSA
jgi:hypothetical protein